MVPKMGLSRSVVLPERMEEDEGGTWRWYTNQGVERARPPPKPNERHMSPWWYHSIAHDEYHDHVPAPSSPTYNDNGMTSTAHQQPLAPDGSYINDNKPNDEGQWGYLYHPIAHDWYRVPDDDYGMTSTTAYDEGTTTTAAPQYDGSYTNNNKLVWIDNQAGDDVGRVRPPPKPNEEQWWYHSTAHDWYRVPAPSSPTYNDNGYDNNGNHPIAGTYNHCTEGANQHGHRAVHISTTSWVIVQPPLQWYPPALQIRRPLLFTADSMRTNMKVRIILLRLHWYYPTILQRAIYQRITVPHHTC